jgi:hypothetical protein
MNEEAALNEATAPQASNASNSTAPRYEARPNSAHKPNPRKSGEPVQKIPVNSE